MLGLWGFPLIPLNRIVLLHGADVCLASYHRCAKLCDRFLTQSISLILKLREVGASTFFIGKKNEVYKD